MGQREPGCDPDSEIHEIENIAIQKALCKRHEHLGIPKLIRCQAPPVSYFQDGKTYAPDNEKPCAGQGRISQKLWFDVTDRKPQIAPVNIEAPVQTPFEVLVLEESLKVQVKENTTQSTIGEIRPDNDMFVFGQSRVHQCRLVSDFNFDVSCVNTSKSTDTSSGTSSSTTQGEEVPLDSRTAERTALRPLQYPELAASVVNSPSSMESPVMALPSVETMPPLTNLTRDCTSSHPSTPTSKDITAALQMLENIQQKCRDVIQTEEKALAKQKLRILIIQNSQIHSQTITALFKK